MSKEEASIRLKATNFMSGLVLSEHEFDYPITYRPDITALVDWAHNTNLLAYLPNYYLHTPSHVPSFKKKRSLQYINSVLLNSFLVFVCFL